MQQPLTHPSARCCARTAAACRPRATIAARTARAVAWLALLATSWPANVPPVWASSPAATEPPASPAATEPPAPPAEAGTPTRPRTCLVLSGGGARGAAHVGVLKVLEELRVPIDCVVGTSMGSLVGAAYAAGLAPERIERYVREADWDRLLSDRPERAERSVYAKELERARIGGAEVGFRRGELVLPQGLLVGHRLQLFLQNLVRTARVEDFDRLALPFRAVATDFETGGLVVIGRGDLAGAMRASMSVPGVFAPVDRDGQLLVDGGLVRNLPVDVARELGAEVVIAVNLGTPLLPRERLGSLVAAAEQTLNILMHQNVRASLAELRPGDVLITPELDELAAADFGRAAEAIPAGEAAAWQAAPRLAALALPPAHFERWRAAQRREPGERRYARLRVDTSGLLRVSPRSVDALLVGTYAPERLDRGLARLLGTDDFQGVEAREADGPDGTTLVLRPVEKSWGPQYLRFGANLNADLHGDSGFTFAVDHRATWLNRRGLEWRNRLSVGRVNAWSTELRQPLDDGRRWFVSTRGSFLQEQRDLYVSGQAVAAYRNRRATGGFDVGRRLRNYGEAKLGAELGRAASIRRTGLELPFADSRRQTAAVTASFIADRLDDLEFPRSGHLVAIDARRARVRAGGDDEYDRVELRAEHAFGHGSRSLLLKVRYGTALGGSLPLYDPFAVGGFLDVSGLDRDEVLASRYAAYGAVFRQRIAGRSGLLPGLYVGASLEFADLQRTLYEGPDREVLGGSLFLSADSFLGPFYVGAGIGEAGRRALYLYVGRP